MLNRVFIIGSGNSINQEIFPLLKNEFTFGINETIQFFESTVAVYGDWYCYYSRYAQFSNHPLVIGRYSNEYNHPEFEFPKHKDLILLNSSQQYNGNEGLQKGLYTPILTGAFALSLAIQLGFKNIFLLGFDNTAINGKTHWYQNIKGAGEFKDLDGLDHCGVGYNYKGEYKSSIYNRDDNSLNELWKPFLIEKKVNIVNVSPFSRITVFDKCGYNCLFSYLIRSPQNINQNEVRKTILNTVIPYKVNII